MTNREVKIFHPTGLSGSVLESSVKVWLEQGWSTEPFELPVVEESVEDAVGSDLTIDGEPDQED